MNRETIRSSIGVLRHADEILLRIMRIALVILMGTMTTAVLLQVITRYFFTISLNWSEELARLSLVCVIFIGAAVLARSEDHLKVDTFTLLLPERVRSGLAIFANLVGLYCTYYLVAGSFRALNREWAQLTPAMQLPMGVIYSIVFGSLVMMVLFLIVNAVRHARDLATGYTQK